jgi:hypothetical protein
MDVRLDALMMHDEPDSFADVRSEGGPATIGLRADDFGAMCGSVRP